jgi:Cu2+-exporting ATPase
MTNHGKAHDHVGHAEHAGHSRTRVVMPNTQVTPDMRRHDKHAGHSVAMFRDKFWLSLLLTLPTLIWGHMLPGLLGYTPRMFPAPTGFLWC